MTTRKNENTVVKSCTRGFFCAFKLSPVCKIGKTVEKLERSRNRPGNATISLSEAGDGKIGANPRDQANFGVLIRRLQDNSTLFPLIQDELQVRLD